MRQLLCSAVLVTLLAACMAGCGEGEQVEKAKQSSNMRALAIAYGQFTSQNRGRPPRNEEQLRKFIESKGPEFLESFGAETIDDMFISSRDGQPYVVVYGKPADIVAYEQEGVDGKRFVATVVGSTEEMDEAKFRQAVPDAE